MKHFFTEIRLSRRLLGVGLVFALLVGVLLWPSLQDTNEELRAAQRELAGNAQQRPLMECLHRLPVHELATSNAPARSAAARQMDALVAQLAGEPGFSSGTTTARPAVQPSTVKQEWEALKVLAATLPAADARSRYRQIRTDIRTLMAQTGDRAGLVRDPDFGGHYLMEAMLGALPQMQDRLAETLAVGADLLARTNGAAEKRGRLLTAAALLEESGLNRTRSSLDKAFAATASLPEAGPVLQKNLSPELAAFGAASEQFLALTREVAAGKRISAETYLAVGFALRAKTQLLWNLTAAEMDALLNARIGGLQRQRLAQMGLAFLTLGLSLLLVWCLARSLIPPLRHLKATLDAQAECLAETTAKLDETSRCLAAGAGAAAVTLEETGASVEQMKNLAGRLAAQAQAARETAATLEAAIRKNNGDSLAAPTVTLEKLVSEIAAATGEQAQGFSLVQQALNRMATVVKTAADSAPQVMDASEALRSQAAALDEGRAALRTIAGEKLPPLIVLPADTFGSAAQETLATEATARPQVQRHTMTETTSPFAAVETPAKRRPIVDDSFKDA